MTKTEIRDIKNMSIYEKINRIKEEILEHEFVMDKVLPVNLGGSEYASISQYYKVMQKETLKYNVLFKWDVLEEVSFEKNIFQVSGKLPQHLHTVQCLGTFINIDNPDEVVEYMSIASGSDSLDKGVSSASTMAFRNWFDKNFTPKYLNTCEEEIIDETKTEEPKIPTYIPPEKKEQLVEKVVNEKQVDDNEEYKQSIIAKIMDVRSKLGNDSWGENTVNSILTEELSSADLLSIELKVNNKLDSLS